MRERAPETTPSSRPAIMIEMLKLLIRWLLPRDRSEQYLAAAIDLADLERRMRRLERTPAGPFFVTFNH
jgi:hypothetical protein